MPARYVVGADGGNSKTDLVLASVDGAVLARVRGSGTRPHRNGLGVTVDRLAELVRRAVQEAGLPATTGISVGTFCLANVDLPDEEEAMHAALTAVGVAERIEVWNDTFAVLRAGTAHEWGVAVVAGAGINAVGLRPDGGQERFLALGTVTGDWGGGYSVAVAGIGAAVRAADGRGPQTVLRELVVETFGDAAEQTAVAIDRGKIEYERVFDFAPVVFQAATAGDAMAVEIVCHLADEVVSMAGALLRRMEMADAEADVVLGGGTLQSGNQLLLNRIDDQLRLVAPRARVRVLDVPPVAGAVVTALAAADASEHAVGAARSALVTA